MAKKNSFLAKMEAKQEQELAFMRRFTMQQCKDMMLIAAHEAFGFGPDRAKVLGDTFDKVFLEYAQMTIADSRDDKELWYTKEKVDTKLKEVCGENFSPWQERYG